MKEYANIIEISPGKTLTMVLTGGELDTAVSSLREARDAKFPPVVHSTESVRSMVTEAAPELKIDLAQGFRKVGSILGNRLRLPELKAGLIDLAKGFRNAGSAVVNHLEPILSLLRNVPHKDKAAGFGDD